jgi:hypothetical protein
VTKHEPIYCTPYPVPILDIREQIFIFVVYISYIFFLVEVGSTFIMVIPFSQSIILQRPDPTGSGSNRFRFQNTVFQSCGRGQDASSALHKSTGGQGSSALHQPRLSQAAVQASPLIHFSSPEMGVTDIILAKIYRFSQLSSHSHEFLLGFRFLNP